MSGLVKTLVETLRTRDLMIATAESCTGGLISSWITEVSGASSVFDRSFVTYSNQSKIDMLGISREVIKEHGAVSKQVAAAMAIGALKNSRSDIALSVTGVAGPNGGTKEKPVGLVHFGLARYGEGDDFIIDTFHHIFNGNRTSIQKQAAEFILQETLKQIEH